MKNLIQKIRYKLISLLARKTPVVLNSEIIKGNLQVRHYGFYKNVYFS